MDELDRDAVKAARIRARREIRWYLRVLRHVPRFVEQLLDGLTDAILVLFLADEECGDDE